MDLLFFYKIGTCLSKLLIFATIAPLEIRRITVPNVTSGWEVLKLKLSFAAIALLGIRRTTVLSATSGWEEVKPLPMYAITVDLEIRKVIA